MEFRKILVPITGTDIDEESVKIACRLAKPWKGQVYVVYIITVKRSLPLDAEINSEIDQAEKTLDRMESIASGMEYPVETDVLQARDTGSAIVDEIVERSADFVIMGVNYMKRFGKFYTGETITYVLKNAPCRVLLYQQYE